MSKAEQLIACLEGEIASRDVEIERVTANCNALDDQNDQLRAELSALKAQEPIGWYTEDHLDDKSATTYSWTVAERWVEKGWPVAPLYAAPVSEAKAQEPVEYQQLSRYENWDRVDKAVFELGRLSSTPERFRALYAAPVSEAKAQDFDPLVCDYCNAETQDPWHGSGMLNGAESHHIHACNQCRNLLPPTKAQGVVMPEPDFWLDGGATHCYYAEPLRALLSAPSPAGVDGLEVECAATYVSEFMRAVPSGLVPLLDRDQLCRLSAAQAIIDGLRGEVEVMTQHANNYSRMFEECAEERDQQAQRIGELEGLLMRVQVSLSLDDTEWGYSGAEKYKLLADIRAALPASKDSDQ